MQRSCWRRSTCDQLLVGLAAIIDDLVGSVQRRAGREPA
jgi:hypothetical protein